jgi:hypothetical protein
MMIYIFSDDQEKLIFCDLNFKMYLIVALNYNYRKNKLKLCFFFKKINIRAYF